MNKEILRLAIPNIISNVSVPLLSSVDTALMGQLSTLHLGAIGLGTMVFNFLYWNFGFLRMGTTGITAQAFGKKDDSEIIRTFFQSLLLAGFIGVMFILLQVPLIKAGCFLLNVSEEQVPLVSSYFLIRIWAAPATLGLFALMGWFFGMQNAIFPLILTVMVNILNIALSVFFFSVLNWEIRAVAWGTVIAQYSGLLIGISLFLFRYRNLLPNLVFPEVFRQDKLRRFMQVNGDIFIRTMFITLVFAAFYSFSSGMGAEILAVNVILLQFISWMAYGIDGFAFASESLVGKYAGLRDKEKLQKVIRYIFYWGMSIAAMFSLLYGVMGAQLAGIFTKEPEVVRQALPYLFWMVLMPILSTPSYLWDGIFIGLTASRAMRNTMLLAFGLFFLAYFIQKPMNLANHGLWLAMMVFLTSRGIIQYIWVKTGKVKIYTW